MIESNAKTCSIRGCVACHGPKEAVPDAGRKVNHEEEDDEDRDPALAARRAIKPVAIPLGHVGTKYTVKSLSEFLFQPLHVRSSGRMPDMKLTPAESLAVAGYLIGEQPQSVETLFPTLLWSNRGRSTFNTSTALRAMRFPALWHSFDRLLDQG